MRPLFCSLVLVAGCAHGTHPHHEEAKASGHVEHHRHGHEHRFQDPAAMAARWDEPARDVWQKPAELVAAMQVEEGMTVADIGTGTGYLLPHLVRAVGRGRVIAQDIEVAMLEWVSARAAREGWTNVATLRGQPDDPGFEEGSLDRAVMVNVWHHVRSRESFGAKLAVSLRRGGRLVIVEARPGAPGDGPPEHYRLRPEQVIAELEAAGLEGRLLAWENERQYAVEGRRK